MAKIYKTAMGKNIDIDGLRLINEHVIAVGNMKVNAGGDQLGPGGKIVKTRDQIMKEYYALNTPVAVDPSDNIASHHNVKPDTSAPIQGQPVDSIIPPNSGLDEFDNGPSTSPIVDPTPAAVIAAAVTQDSPAPTIVIPPSTAPEPQFRGSLADSVAKTATVTQTEKLPPKKADGIQRF
jgi:hypothetical protein